MSEETFDKDSIAMTASSSLTLRTTSDDDMASLDQASLPMETHPKVCSSSLDDLLFNLSFLGFPCARDRFFLDGNHVSRPPTAVDQLSDTFDSFYSTDEIDAEQSSW